MDNETIELLKGLWYALNWLIDECETNYVFGEDREEMKALDNAQKELLKLTVLLNKIAPELD